MGSDPRRDWIMGRAASAERAILAGDEAVIMRQAGTSPPAMAFVRAEGAWVEDASGRRYLDLHGNNCHHLGHRHPAVLEAIRAQMETLTFVPRGYTAEPIVELGRALLDGWPGGAGRVFMVPGGSAAVELALLLARAHTGRWKTISFHDSYHGRSAGALSLGGGARSRSARLGPLLPGCLHVPPFYPLPGPALDTAESAADRSASAIRDVLVHEGDIAAIIAETVRNGAFTPPPWYWPEIRKLCDAHGTLLVSDEIPTGLGKTGRMFNTEHFGVRPDMTIVGKALGGAILPVAAVIASAALDTTGDLPLGYYTHERNPLLAAAGRAVLSVVKAGGLAARAAGLGARLLPRLRDLLAKNPDVVEVRGAGLMMGLEIGPPSMPGDAREILSGKYLRACADAGVLVIGARNGGITLSFPLTVTEHEAEEALTRVAAGFR